MQLISVWTVQFPTPFIDSVSPVLANNSGFYLSDGWRTPTSDIRLRQVSLISGEEIQSIIIGSEIRCLHLREEEDDFFVVSNNNVFHIEKSDFLSKEIITEDTLKDGDYINCNNRGSLLIMNSQSDSLIIYDLKDKKVIKKNINGCRGIVKESENTFLIFSPYQEEILKYSVSDNTLIPIKTIGVFHSVIQGQSGEILLHMGELNEAEHRIMPLPVIHYYPSLIEENPYIFSFNFHFNKIVCHNYTLYLINNNILYRFSLINRELIDKYEFERTVKILSVFPESNHILTYEYSRPDTLSCWLFS